jgi:hypothetical protein
LADGESLAQEGPLMAFRDLIRSSIGKTKIEFTRRTDQAGLLLS